MSASLVYPGEAYFFLVNRDHDPPDVLRGLALREGAARRSGALYRVALPKKWTPELTGWVSEIGLKAAPRPRVRWQALTTDQRASAWHTCLSDSIFFPLPAGGSARLSGGLTRRMNRGIGVVLMDRVCACCGLPLGAIDAAIAFRRPIHYFMFPEAQRAERVRDSDDVVIVDGRIFVIRGVMEIPIVDLEGEHFEWGFWASVSPRAFARYAELYSVDAEGEPPFPGLLAVSPATYPDLLDAPVTVQLRSASLRPLFQPTSFEHPLFREYRDGITQQRWHQIVVENHAYQAKMR